MKNLIGWGERTAGLKVTPLSLLQGLGAKKGEMRV